MSEGIFQNGKRKTENGKLFFFFLSHNQKIAYEYQHIQNRQWLGYFCALRSSGERSIVDLCEHLRCKQGAKRANQNDFSF